MTAPDERALHLVRSIGLSIFAVLAGCASVPADLGRADVDVLTAERGLPTDASAATSEPMQSLLASPLTADSAVRIALLNSAQLQASYAALGFAAADLYEGGRVRNPIFSGALLYPDIGGERTQLTLGIAASFTDFITLPARKRLSRAAFAAAKQSVGADVVAVAAEAGAAYFDYVGALQVAALRQRVAKAANLSATLAERYHAAGNISARELALERAAAAEAQLQALDADAVAVAARTALGNVLGISVGDAWTAPAALPLPLTEEESLEVLLARARDSRLDLAAARTRVELLADRLGVVEWNRWLGELEVGAERERETDGSHITGPTLSWEVPVFTQRRDEALRANAEWQIAISEVRRITTEVDNGVHLAHAAVSNAKAKVDAYRERLIPQRIEAVARAQEEVNFMLIGIFELIAIKQQEYDAYQGYLESIRDYWLARVALSRASGHSLPASASAQHIDVQQLVRPPPAMDHSKHGGHGSMHDGHESSKTRPKDEHDHGGMQ